MRTSLPPVKVSLTLCRKNQSGRDQRQAGQHGGLDLSRREDDGGFNWRRDGEQSRPIPKRLPVSMASSGGLPGNSDCESDVEPATEPVEHGKDRTPRDAKMQLLHLHQV